MPEFVHMELNTSDPAGAKKFYKSVFGWKYEDMKMPAGVYTMLAGAEGPFGGLQQLPMPNVPPHWLGYIGVKSIKTTVAKAKKAGAQVVAEYEVPGMGKGAIFTDPQGAAIAVWESLAPAPAKKKSKKKAKKKAAKKKATKKKAAKKKATKKKAAKKATKKKAAKKKATKKKAKKR